MSVSKRDIKILLYAVGLIAVLAVWRFIFTPVTATNQILETQNDAIRSEITKLRMMEAEQDEYVSKTLEYESENQELLSHFPADVREEDILLYANDLEQRSKSFFSMVQMNTPQLVLTSLGMTTEADTSAAETTEGTEVSTESDIPHDLYNAQGSYRFSVTYGELKNILTWIAEAPNRIVLDYINLYFDSSTGEMGGDMTLNFYYMLGTDSVYQEPYIPAMPIGTESPFGTLTNGGVQVAQNNAAANTDAAGTTTNNGTGTTTNNGAGTTTNNGTGTTTNNGTGTTTDNGTITDNGTTTDNGTGTTTDNGTGTKRYEPER